MLGQILRLNTCNNQDLGIFFLYLNLCKKSQKTC